MNALIEQAKGIAATAAAESRILTEDERGIVETAIAGAKALKADADLLKAVDSLGEAIGEVKETSSTTAVPRTPGAKALNDPAFKAWLAGATAAGTPDVKSLITSPAVAVGGLKATIFGSDDQGAGALIDATRRPGVASTLTRDLSVLALITMGNTDSDLVEYAQTQPYGMGGSVNAAAPVAEGAAAPESTLKLAKMSAPVRDIRTFIPASTRALSDAAQMQTLISGFVSYGVSEALENEIVSGDGTGEHMTGILNTSGILSQAFDTDLVATVRKAIRRVRTDGRARPTAVLVNPEDQERIDLLSGPSTDYLFGGPVGVSTPTIWGLPRIESEAIPAGYAIVGDFRQALLWERSPVSVSVYPQHSDYAVRGLVAIVAQARAAFGVLNAGAFCVASLTD